MNAAIDRFFKVSERGSTIGTEVRAGVVSFFAMAYIILLNPLILILLWIQPNRRIPPRFSFFCLILA